VPDGEAAEANIAAAGPQLTYCHMSVLFRRRTRRPAATAADADPAGPVRWRELPVLDRISSPATGLAR